MSVRVGIDVGGTFTDAVMVDDERGEVRRTKVLTRFKGPRMVVKCQACYHTLAVQRPSLEDNWPPFRAAGHDWDRSPAERASSD